MANFTRQLIFKVYSEAGVYLGVIDDVVSDFSIRKMINGGDSEFKFTLARKFDDFDEDVTIKFNNRIKVFLKDGYAANSAGNTLIAYGYIVSYAPSLQGKEESVEVTCLSAVSKLSNDFYRTGNTLDASQLGIELTSLRADEMMEAIITHYRSIEANSMISSDFSNADSTTDAAGTPTSFTNRFFNMKHLDALREVAKFLPKNKTGGYWQYWRIDTDGKLWVKNLSTTADHKFIIGKHIKEINGEKSMMDIVNRMYFWNEKGTVDPDYINLTNDDSTSQGEYDIMSEYLTDSKITNAIAAGLLTTAKLYDKKDPKVVINIVLTGDYDLASIKPGQTCTLLNAKNNPYKIGSDNVLLIESIEYNVDSAILSLSNGRVSFADIVEEERQRLDKEMTWFGYITQQLTAAQLAPADRTWVTDIKFTSAVGADAYRNVTWVEGIVYIPAGASGQTAVRKVAAGESGVMAAATPYIIYLDELNKPAAAALETGAAGVIERGSQYLTDLSKAWTTNEWAGHVVVINGERQIIRSNTATTLEVEEYFIAAFTGAYTISRLAFSVTSSASVATSYANVIFSNIAANANTSSQAIITPAGTGDSYNIDGGTQIAEYSIPNAKIIDLTVSKLTAGTITSKAIVLAVDDGTGDSFIAAGKTDFTNLQTGFILGIDDSDSNKAKFYIGNTTSYFNWDGVDVTIAGILNATSGNIGGWYITATVLRSSAISDALSNIVLDPTTSVLRLGPTAGNYITLDGGNQYIESSNYVSGPFGAGFHLDSDLLEVGNAAIRGTLRSAVFQKDNINVMGGNFAVLDGDTLATDMTALDASTLEIRGNTTFAVGDILRMKDSTHDEWLEVTNIGSAPIYSVNRDKAAAYGANANPAWPKGTTVVNYKQSGAGGIYMTASEANAPYLSIFNHAGSPWSTITTRLRIGNLNGYLGYVTDLYGIGIGAAGNSLSYDSTNGLRITGTITGGTIRTAASGARVVIEGSDNSLRFYDSSAQVIGIGVSSSVGIQINLNSTVITGINITATTDTTGGAGFYYSNSGAVSNRGLYIELTNSSVDNDLPGLEVRHYGGTNNTHAGFFYGRNGANGLYIDVSDSGNGISIANAGTGQSIRIIESGTTGSVSGVYLEYRRTGAAFDIDVNASSGNPTGIKISAVKSGGNAYAFNFVGATDGETVGSAVSGTNDKKIRVLAGGAVYYIPLYDG